MELNRYVRGGRFYFIFIYIYIFIHHRDLAIFTQAVSYTPVRPVRAVAEADIRKSIPLTIGIILI